MSHESFETCRGSSRFQRVQRFYKDVDRMLTLTREDADLWIRQRFDNVGFMPNPCRSSRTSRPRARPRRW